MYIPNYMLMIDMSQSQKKQITSTKSDTSKYNFKIKKK